MIKFFESFMIVYPIFFFLMSLVLILFFGIVFYSYSWLDSFSYSVSMNMVQVCGFQMILTFFLFCQQLFFMDLETSFYLVSLFDGLFCFDYSVCFFQTFLILLFGLFFLYFNSESNKVLSFEVSFLFCITFWSLLFLLNSFDIISFYLLFELCSLGLYMLASLFSNSAFSTEAGLKYYIVGSFASCCFLLGISLFFGLTGLNSFEDLHLLFLLPCSDVLFNVLLFLSCIFIILAFFLKLGIVPFHMWMPDVFEGAPTYSVIFFSLFPKFVFIMMLFSLLTFPFFSFLFFWQNLLSFSIVFSLFVGSLFALYQWRFKRFLAYSSMTHMGYFLIALLCFSIEGTQALLFYITFYSMTIFCVWYCVAFSKMKYLTDLISMFTQNNMLGSVLLICLFSLSGFPPFVGFLSKFFVLVCAFKNGLYLPVIFGLFLSLMSSFYYLRLVKLMFFEFFSMNMESKIVWSLVPKKLFFSIIMLVSSLVYIIFFPSSVLMEFYILAFCFF